MYACEAIELDPTGKKAKLIATLRAWIMQPEIEARLAAERAERERQHRIDSRAIVWTCGHGPYGQLGQGEGVTRLDRPARITSLRERNVREVFTGLEADVVFAKDAEEVVMAWGGGNSCADLIRGAVRERVKASFQLEKDLKEDPSWLERQKVRTYWDPVDLQALTKLGKTDAGAPEKVVCVNVTRSHAVATTTSGDMWTWGKNTKGQLGLTKDLTRNQFVPEFCGDFAEDFDKVVKRSLAVGRNHAAVVLADTRSLLVWGATTCGQLGVNDQKLAEIGTPDTRRREAKRIRRLKREGRWVDPNARVLSSIQAQGAGRDFASCEALPVRLPFFAPRAGPNETPTARTVVAQVSCGAAHTACCTLDGRCYSWGCGDAFRLGQGEDCADRDHPGLLASLRGLRVVGVDCGVWHTLATVEIEEQRGVVASVSPEKFPDQAGSLLRLQRRHAGLAKLARRRGLAARARAAELASEMRDDTPEEKARAVATAVSARGSPIRGGGKRARMLRGARTKRRVLYSWGTGHLGQLGRVGVAVSPRPAPVDYFLPVKTFRGAFSRIGAERGGTDPHRDPQPPFRSGLSAFCS